MSCLLLICLFWTILKALNTSLGFITWVFVTFKLAMVTAASVILLPRKTKASMASLRSVLSQLLLPLNQREATGRNGTEGHLWHWPKHLSRLGKCEDFVSGGWHRAEDKFANFPTLLSVFVFIVNSQDIQTLMHEQLSLEAITICTFNPLHSGLVSTVPSHSYAFLVILITYPSSQLSSNEKIRPLSLIIMSYFSWPVFYYLMKFLNNRLRLTLYFSPSYGLTHSSTELHWTPQNHDVPIFLLFETLLIATTTHYWMNLMAYRAFVKTEAVLSINWSYSSLILLVAFLLQRPKARHWTESERP